MVVVIVPHSEQIYFVMCVFAIMTEKFPLKCVRGIIAT